jgi:uncharacterized protein with PQ loop repeat
MNKLTDIIGWSASIMAILMYVSFIDQIRLNLLGHKGSIILPIVAIINCSFWVLYGCLKQKKDFPIITCNIIGVIASTITVITAL